MCFFLSQEYHDEFNLLLPKTSYDTKDWCICKRFKDFPSAPSTGFTMVMGLIAAYIIILRKHFEKKDQTQLKPFKWRKYWLLLLNIVWKFTFNACFYNYRNCREAVRVRTDKVNFGPTTIVPGVQPIHRMYIITCTFSWINSTFSHFWGGAFRVHCPMGVVALWIRHHLHRSSGLVHVLSRCFAAVMTKSV